MKIREMVIADYEPCRALWLDMPGVRLTDADTEEAIAAFLQRNPGMSFVCEENGRIIGTAMCGHDGRRGYIYHVAVEPAYRGGRIGTKLVDACLGKLKEEGINKCHVFVVADNAPGNAFWSKSWGRRSDIHVYSKNIQ